MYVCVYVCESACAAVWEVRREEEKKGQREGKAERFTEIKQEGALELDTVCSKFMQCRHNNSWFGSYLCPQSKRMSVRSISACPVSTSSSASTAHAP